MPRGTVGNTTNFAGDVNRQRNKAHAREQANQIDALRAELATVTKRLFAEQARRISGSAALDSILGLCAEMCPSCSPPKQCENLADYVTARVLQSVDKVREKPVICPHVWQANRWHRYSTSATPKQATALAMEID